MRLAAVGTAAQLPHNGEALSRLFRRLKIVAQFEEALDKPGLPVEPVVGQHRFGAQARGGEARGKRGAAGHQISSCRLHALLTASLKAAALSAAKPLGVRIWTAFPPRSSMRPAWQPWRLPA